MNTFKINLHVVCSRQQTDITLYKENKTDLSNYIGRWDKIEGLSLRKNLSADIE